MAICHLETKYLDNMRFTTTIETEEIADHKSETIKEVTSLLNDFLQAHDYGDGIRNYNVGVICIKTRPGYEKWYKIRKPRLAEYETFKKFDGTILEFKNAFYNDIKIDGEEFDYFVICSNLEAKKLLAKKIVESFINLDTLPKKVKDFDKARFLSDVKFFLKEQGLLD
jgi:hypothetical protein